MKRAGRPRQEPMWKPFGRLLKSAEIPPTQEKKQMHLIHTDSDAPPAPFAVIGVNELDFAALKAFSLASHWE